MEYETTTHQEALPYQEELPYELTRDHPDNNRPPHIITCAYDWCGAELQIDDHREGLVCASHTVEELEDIEYERLVLEELL